MHLGAMIMGNGHFEVLKVGEGGMKECRWRLANIREGLVAPAPFGAFLGGGDDSKLFPTHLAISSQPLLHLKLPTNIL